MMPYFPKYMFADPCGPALPFRPLFPVRLYDRRWAWLKRCWRQRMVVHGYLSGPRGEFWSYTDQDIPPFNLEQQVNQND